MMKLFKILLLAGFISFFALSCGSGGGGGDGDSSNNNGGGGGNGASATGTVSQQSTNDFLSFVTDNVSGCTSQTSSPSTKSIILDSVLISGKDIYGRIQSVHVQPESRSLAVDVFGPINGDCGGSLSITAPNENSFPISISFNQYCTSLDGENATIDGDIDVDGKLDSNNIPTQISASASGISITTDTESLTAAFDVSSTFTSNMDKELSGLDATITSFSVTDNNANQVYSLENTKIQASGLDTDSLQIKTNGTYKDPELGTFVFNTPQAMTVDTKNDTAMGTIVVDGANNTQIELTINDDDEIFIKADTDGDGTSDVSETLDCSSASLDLPTQ